MISVLLLTGPALAAPSSQNELGACRTASLAAERAEAIPDRLMHAIGIVESGRRDSSGVLAPWPWTINAEGVGSYYATKAEAIAAVNALRARGVRSIDVGCMQVNLVHHGDAFASLDEAFDPAANARYAARFLRRLLAQTGSWPAATAGYHSLTPELGGPYARKVLAILSAPEPQPQPGWSARAFAAAPATPGWPVPSSQPATGSGNGGFVRLLPAPTNGSFTSASNAPVGRGLDAYRASPTPLAARFGRS